MTESNGRGASRKHGHTSNNSMGKEYNIAILGALGVGKSAFTVKYLTKRFIMEYDPTLEGTYTKTESVDGQICTIRVMDTCDKEGCNPDRYLQWAAGFIVVYCITNRPSFETAQVCLEAITQCQQDKPIALVGNKMDLERYRTVSSEEGKALASQFDCAFYEASAAEDYESVQRVFHDIIHEISRITMRQMPLEQLFISEDKAMTAGPGIMSRTPRRLRAPNQKTESKDSKTDPRTLPKRSVSTFKLFNKSFKIFN